MISVEKEDICNFDGRVIEVEKLLKNNCWNICDESGKFP